MDQLTFQTIIEGGILVTLVFFGSKLIAVLQGIANSLSSIDETTKGQTSTGGNTGGGGGGTVKS